jgi:hypothetical protein
VCITQHCGHNTGASVLVASSCRADSASVAPNPPPRLLQLRRNLAVVGSSGDQDLRSMKLIKIGKQWGAHNHRSMRLNFLGGSQLHNDVSCHTSVALRTSIPNYNLTCMGKECLNGVLHKCTHTHKVNNYAGKQGKSLAMGARNGHPARLPPPRTIEINQRSQTLDTARTCRGRFVRTGSFSRPRFGGEVVHSFHDDVRPKCNDTVLESRKRLLP